MRDEANGRDGGAVDPGVPTGNTYDKYTTRNPIERRLMAGFMRTLDSMLPTEPPARILEVGAGEGEVTSRLRSRFPDAEIVALDLPDPMLTAHWGDWHAVFGSADTLPFPDSSFDLVLAIEVLEHVDAPAAAVAEMARVADSRIVASVPREPLWRALNMARAKYWGDLGNTPGHIQHWGTRGFRSLMATAVTIDRVATPTPWTFASGTPRR
ncbi:MAG: class I SAM-dependent methyltransferase [Acidimicrobiales bacterium]